MIKRWALKAQTSMKVQKWIHRTRAWTILRTYRTTQACLKISKTTSKRVPLTSGSLPRSATRNKSRNEQATNSKSKSQTSWYTWRSTRFMCRRVQEWIRPILGYCNRAAMQIKAALLCHKTRPWTKKQSVRGKTWLGKKWLLKTEQSTRSPLVKKVKAVSALTHPWSHRLKNQSHPNPNRVAITRVCSEYN